MARCIMIIMFSICCSDTIIKSIKEAYNIVEHKYNYDEGLIYFLHDQFETMPYFMNWCKDCARPEIIDTQTMKKLGDSKTVDRTPELFLSDWVDDHKRYKYGNQQFRTFGWCSEYEMSFCAILKAMGYKCKVYQRGNHVTTRVWLEHYQLDVDNTFDEIHKIPINQSYEEWRNDLGVGGHKEWYNRVTEESVEVVKSLETSPYFKARMISYANIAR